MDIAKIYYKALLRKDQEYDGVFFFGVKTTGIFCRPTCSARKPKFENCEFFKTAKDALISFYRPCKRCSPLAYPGEASDIVKKLIDEIEKKPEKRWRREDFEEISTDSITARRHFKQRFGMTFVQYARARRMSIACQQIRRGNSIINSQIDMGYESGSGFREAFSRTIGVAPSKLGGNNQLILHASWIDTLLGPMITISDSDHLYLLEFSDGRGVEKEIEKLKIQKNAIIVPGDTKPITMIKKELGKYFSGDLTVFETPFQLMGSDFQKEAWSALQEIPYGQTRSYLQQAKYIGNEKAFRAVANANGANQLAIIIPCHRIINHGGALGGYGGGIVRKEWLINHEKKVCRICEKKYS